MARGSLLLVDDDRGVLESMASWLRDQGFAVLEAGSCTEAQDCMDGQPIDLVLSDIRLPDGDGFDLLEYSHQCQQPMSVILMTGYATVETGIEALRAGAFDLLTKPLIDAEVLMSIDRALSQRRVLEENRNLKAQLHDRFGMEHIVGHDPGMQKVFDIVNSVADARATVLVTGENGTGKSMIARAMHHLSRRAAGPFVEVACGSLPETLLESELFGHVAGAFTGAVADKKGKFEQADQGTIFLDEIATASRSFQVKLLRVLQDFEFERVGGTETIRSDTRVILATNEDLHQAVLDGRFRQDLFYRVNVVNLELPPLRERRGDIPMLAHRFLQDASGDAVREVRGIADETLEVLQDYRWPGNVRELQNAMERAVLLGKNPLIQPHDLPAHLLAQPDRQVPLVGGQTLKESLEGPERQIILNVLRANDWNRIYTAASLGINRTTLYKKMKRLGLDSPSAEEYEAQLNRSMSPGIGQGAVSNANTRS